MKQITFNAHFNNEIAIDVAQTSPMAYLDKNNNILLDKSYDLSTYIFKMYQLNNK